MNQCNKAASQRSNRSLFVQQSFAFGVYLGVLTCNLLKAASRRHVEYAVKLQTDLLFAA